MRLRVKILQTGKTACGIEIPATVVAGLGPSDPDVVAERVAHADVRSVAAVRGSWLNSTPRAFSVS